MSVNKQNRFIYPFVKILPLVVFGILIAQVVHLSVWLVAVACATALAASLVWRNNNFGGLYTALFIVLFSMCLTGLRTTREYVPKDQKVVMNMLVVDNPVRAGRWMRCSAVVESYRAESDSTWHGSGEKMFVYLDSLHHVSAGNRVVVNSYANPLAEDYDSQYCRLMRRRGYTAKCYVTQHAVCEVVDSGGFSIGVLAARFQSMAVDRFNRLGLNERQGAVCRAMTFGYRSDMDQELKESYSLSGTAHILAVSGLHVGIVAMIVNALFYLLPLLRWGHIVRNILSVIVIWLYAAVTGFTPSVLRAALMFSGFQLALASSSRNGGANMLAATASLMLLVNPNMLFDVSFQLSFVAVAGIYFGVPVLFRPLECRFRLVNLLTSLFLIGVVCSLATAPIVSHQFGRLPVAGIFISPLMVLSANVILLFSILWSVAPIAFFAPMFRAVLGFTADFQNRLALFCSDKWWNAVDYRMPLWAVLTVYGVVVAAIIVAKVVRRKREAKIELVSDK